MEGSFEDDDNLFGTMEGSRCSDNDDNNSSEVMVSRMMMLHMKWFNNTAAASFHGGTFFNFHTRETLLTVDGFDHIIEEHITNNPPKTCWVPIIPLCEPPVLSNGRHIISAALANLEEEFRHEITRHVLAFAASDNGNPSRSLSSIDVDIKLVSGCYLIGEDEFTWEDIEYEHEILTRSQLVDEDDQGYAIVTYLPCRLSYVKDSRLNILEVIVRRIKLRMKFNDPSFHATFKVRSLKTLVHDHEYIIYGTNPCSQTCSVPIPLREPPLSTNSRHMHIISAALAKMNVDEEFQHEITRKVLDFAASSGARRNPSVSSIDVDIKVVTGSYLVGRQEEELKWDDIEKQHENMTRSLFVEQDYYTLLSSYLKVPCSEGNHLRAIRYKAEDIMEAQTCAICLHDLQKCHAVNVNVLRMPCNHLFHKHCILSWLRRNINASTCPLCRSIIKLYPS